MFGNDRRLKTIGRYPAISLSEARQEAKRLLAYRTPKNVPMSLKQALSAYLDECEAKNRASTVKQYRYYLSVVDKPLLEDVTKNDIPNDPHFVMAWKVFFNWAIRNELTDRNPFQHIKAVYGKRDRVLTEDEIRAVWHYEHDPYTTIVKLCVLI